MDMGNAITHTVSTTIDAAGRLVARAFVINRDGNFPTISFGDDVRITDKELYATIDDVRGLPCAWASMTMKPAVATSPVPPACVGDRILTLDAKAQGGAVGELARIGITGGAVFDGLVALAARATGHRLISRDARAARAAQTYERLGIEFELLTTAGSVT